MNKPTNEWIFALDIGTRNVVGTLAEMNDGVYTVKDYEMVEHPERSMFDGQIHDIDKVASVISKIKKTLEDRHQIELKKVAIAAAGRALKTARVTTSIELDYTKELTKEVIDSLEMEGIQQAQLQIAESSQRKEPKYYCVGYSIINYYLDQALILNPRGHRGSELSAEMIATFLPHIVVDSLYSAVAKAELEVLNMTLEPIAAINVAIPENLRLLNLALVDVGAGTSDIAITKEGAIVSYGMVSLAGDEITEALAKAYLLDFNTAERLKIQLNHVALHEFTDIVGMTYQYSTDEIMATIEPVVANLANEIARAIVTSNDKAPSAIFCIGGGCQIPKFTEFLADAVGLQKERAVIKGVEHLDKLVFDHNPLRGPEFITPIGIGVTAFKEREHDFLQVSVNENQIRLFNSKSLNVSDALILVGYNARKLIAPRGPQIHYTLNGSKHQILGEYGEPARIYVNGTMASLDTKLKNKDAIHIEDAIPGTERTVRISEVYRSDRKVVFNGADVPLYQGILVNGNHRSLDHIIEDGDHIESLEIKDLESLLTLFDIDMKQTKIKINDNVVDRNVDLIIGDVIVVDVLPQTETASLPQIAEIGFEIEMDQEDAVGASSFITEIQEEGFQFVREVRDIREEKETKLGVVEEFLKSQTKTTLEYTFMVNGERVVVKGLERTMMYVDIFDHYHFDLTKAKGILDLKLNGNRAKYTDELQSGDVIEISWR